MRNLPLDIEESEFKDFFEKFGRIKFARLVKHRETGEYKGTGFVKFVDFNTA